MQRLGGLAVVRVPKPCLGKIGNQAHMALELIKAAALLLAPSLLHGLIARQLRSEKTLQEMLSGCLFGGICVVGMMLPIEVVPGVIFDPRSVILSTAGLFGGTLVTLIAAAVAGGYRLWLGGGGAPSASPSSLPARCSAWPIDMPGTRGGCRSARCGFWRSA